MVFVNLPVPEGPRLPTCLSWLPNFVWRNPFSSRLWIRATSILTPCLPTRHNPISPVCSTPSNGSRKLKPGGGTCFWTPLHLRLPIVWISQNGTPILFRSRSTSCSGIRQGSAACWRAKQLWLDYIVPGLQVVRSGVYPYRAMGTSSFQEERDLKM